MESWHKRRLEERAGISLAKRYCFKTLAKAGEEHGARKRQRPTPTTSANCMASAGRTYPQYSGQWLGVRRSAAGNLGYVGWYYYGAKRLDVTLYSVKLENIEITPQPKWIHTDLKAEVFRANRLSQLSLLEPTATATIAHAFEADLRIKTTNHVRKLSSGKVQVDVTYRHPVAMVLQESGLIKARRPRRKVFMRSMKTV